MPNRERRDPQDIARRSSAGVSPGRAAYGSRSLDPFSQFRRLTDQMERWFEGTIGSTRSGDRSSFNLWSPEIETYLRDDQFIVRADLPGLGKDEVNVEVTEDSLIIHGERQQTHEEEREGFYRSERSYGRFYREIPLPEGALPETAQANYRDGVLEVKLTAPPREVTKPRRIEIGGAASTSGSERPVTTPQSRERSVARDTE
jgi:HSP20 family protein